MMNMMLTSTIASDANLANTFLDEKDILEQIATKNPIISNNRVVPSMYHQL